MIKIKVAGTDGLLGPARWALVSPSASSLPSKPLGFLPSPTCSHAPRPSPFCLYCLKSFAPSLHLLEPPAHTSDLSCSHQSICPQGRKQWSKGWRLGLGPGLPQKVTSDLRVSFPRKLPCYDQCGMLYTRSWFTVKFLSSHVVPKLRELSLACKLGMKITLQRPTGNQGCCFSVSR